MSDDLVKRLTYVRTFLADLPARSMQENHELQNGIEFIQEAADRIEALEVALRKMEAKSECIRTILVNHLDEPERYAFWLAVQMRNDARATLAGTPDEREVANVPAGEWQTNR